MGDVFDCRGDGIPGCGRGVDDYAETFDLEVSLVQDFEEASIIKVMVEWYGKMGVCDGGD